MTDVRITLERCKGIHRLSFDPEFQRAIEAHMDRCPEAGRLDEPSSLYRKFMQAHHDLIETVSAVLGEKADHPFTVTLVVDGSKTTYRPGQWVDY